MKVNLSRILILCSLFTTAYSQSLSIKPYFGYATVRMQEVNDVIKFRVRNLGSHVTTPDLLDGNYAWGIQAEYHTSENYFLNLTTYYFREKSESNQLNRFGQNPFTFLFKQQIEFFEVSFGLHYFFNYNSWKRFNFYLGFGAGLGHGWSESEFFYDELLSSGAETDELIDVSSNALTGYFCGGGIVRIIPMLFLSFEAGIRFANLQQMDGRLRRDDIIYDYLSEEYYDFTGYYFMVGTGFILPFLK